MSQRTDMLDQAIDAWWPTIKEKQGEFYDLHGRYWQGPWTHSATPNAATAPDNVNQIQDTICWADWNLLPATMHSRLRFDVGSHENLRWFAATFETRDEDGLVYQRTLGLNNSGVETDNRLWIPSVEGVE